MMHVLVHHAPDLALQTDLTSKGESQLFCTDMYVRKIDRYLKPRLPEYLLLVDPLDQFIQPTSQEFIRACILRKKCGIMQGLV